MDIVVSPRLKLEVDLTEAGKTRSQDSNGSYEHDYIWSPEQWRHIEMVAYKMLLAQMRALTEWSYWGEAITPEALDYWEEDLPEDLFTSSDDPDLNEHISGCSTAIGVVDAILKQIEEEIGKRGGSLP